jgi:hypothetical protein
MLKNVMLLLILLLVPVNASATAQMPDRILYQGELYPLFSEPLGRYLDEHGPRTKELFFSVCTACWRGYVATWEVKENYLYLTKLVEGTCRPDAKEIPIAALFPGQTAPVKADWFSGDLRIPQGERVRYERRGYGAVYERELYVTIRNGRLVSEMTIDNTKQEPSPRPGP